MRKALLAILFLLVLGCAFAAPEPPTGLNAAFVLTGVDLTWEHPGGEGVSFNVYRGTGFETVELLASVSEKRFLDETVEIGAQYVYLVSAVDAEGEEAVSYNYLTVTPEGSISTPYALAIVAPEQGQEFYSGQETYFAVVVQSPFLDGLKNVKVFLESPDFAESRALEFDANRGLYLVLVKFPEVGAEIEKAYTFRASASYSGQGFEETKTVSVKLLPLPPADPVKLLTEYFWLVIPAVFFALVIALAARYGFFGFKKKLAKEDRLFVELVKVLAKKAIAKQDLLHNRIDSNQFAEQERSAQKRLQELGHALRMSKKDLAFSQNPFAGFGREETKKVVTLLEELVSDKENFSYQGMVEWLVSRGETEKVANRVAKLIYER